MDIKIIIEVITILGSVAASVGAILGTIWWIVQRYSKSKTEQIVALREGERNLHEKLQKGASANIQLQENLQAATSELKKLQLAVEKLGELLQAEKAGRENDAASYDGYRAKWKATHDKLNATISSVKTELTMKSFSHDHLQVIRERIKNISSLDGKLWNRPVPNSAPTFRPRKTPIISILNLKGGVGKTTITANLGATLAQRGKNVLMIDLDFQRSLSRLLLSTDERKMRHLETRCVQHFLTGKAHDADALMKMVGEPISDLANCWFLPNSDSVRDNSSDTPGCADDSLEETEMRLMIEWIFEPDSHDIRFHLREALHDPQMEDRFQYILLDCPPRLTTACINALAASDYVLVPVTLDAMATNSVPYLLKSLDFLKKDILPQLEILGVVANRVKMRSGGPERRDRHAWESLTQQFEGRMPPLYFFKTKIQENAAIGEYATRAIEEDELALRLAICDEKTQANFEGLVVEIEKILGHDDSQPLSPVPAMGSHLPENAAVPADE